LLGIENFAEVQTALEAALRANAKRDYIDEIVRVDDDRGYLLDLITTGALRVDACGRFEA
jgi:hypothetical protein